MQVFHIHCRLGVKQNAYLGHSVPSQVEELALPRGLLLRLGRKATSSDYVCRVTISDQVRQVVVELTRASLTKFQCVKVTERSVRVEVVEESQLARYVAHCTSLNPLKNTEPVKGQAMSSQVLIPIKVVVPPSIRPYRALASYPGGQKLHKGMLLGILWSDVQAVREKGL